MRNLARVIFAVVALFVVAVTVTLVVRSRSARVEPIGPALTTAETPADVDLLHLSTRSAGDACLRNLTKWKAQ